MSELRKPSERRHRPVRLCDLPLEQRLKGAASFQTRDAAEKQAVLAAALFPSVLRSRVKGETMYPEASYSDYQEGASPEKMPATEEIEFELKRLADLTEGLEARLAPVLRSPHPVADQVERVEPSSPLRGVASDLRSRVSKLGYIIDRIDL